MEIQSVKIIEGGYLLNDFMHVPDDLSNAHRRAIADWIELGNTPEPALTAEEAATYQKDKDTLTEVMWAKSALDASDIELAYVQDSDRREVGTVADWRAYRRELRDYTTKDEFGNYTVGVARPVSPRGPFEL